MSRHEGADFDNPFLGNPLNETSTHLDAVKERLDILCNSYGEYGARPDEFAAWIPLLFCLKWHCVFIPLRRG